MDVIKFGLIYPLGLVIERVHSAYLRSPDGRLEANAVVSPLFLALVERLEKYSESERSSIKLVGTKAEPIKSPSSDGRTWIIYFRMTSRPTNLKKTIVVCRKSISLFEEVLNEHKIGGRVAYEFVWAIE